MPPAMPRAIMDSAVSQLHGEEGPHQVHVDHLAELLRGHVGDEAVIGDAGAGDQAVDRAARQDVLEDVAERGLVGDVGGVGVGDADVGPIDDDRGGTGLGQHGCGRGADAAGTAGHDDALVVERVLEYGGLLPSERSFARPTIGPRYSITLLEIMQGIRH